MTENDTLSNQARMLAGLSARDCRVYMTLLRLDEKRQGMSSTDEVAYYAGYAESTTEQSIRTLWQHFLVLKNGGMRGWPAEWQTCDEKEIDTKWGQGTFARIQQKSMGR